jgi:hypothetical protein
MPTDRYALVVALADTARENGWHTITTDTAVDRVTMTFRPDPAPDQGVPYGPADDTVRQDNLAVLDAVIPRLRALQKSLRDEGLTP